MAARLTLKTLSESLTSVARSLSTAVADLGAQRTRTDELEARVAELEARCDRLAQRARSEAPARPAPQDDERYPLVDGLGRRYRLDGRVKCFAPGH